MKLRPATARDEAQILALNADAVAVTSPMDSARFRALRDQSGYLVVAEAAGKVAGFLMGFEDGADYDSPNYLWFAERLKRFFYVDRIVVAESQRGAGFGSVFYRAVFEHARAEGLHWVVAEMNLEPPNEASLRFHARHGFVELGVQRLGPHKRVSLQARPL